jgi:hemerythrin-like metal-binding protein
VNVAEIDQQHQKLAALINQLNEAMSQGKGKEVTGKILTELINYTSSHFALEEKYFDKFAYPETLTHKKAHAELVKKVVEFQEGFNKGSLTLSLELMRFLKDWLIVHIQGTDKKYSAFFNEKGLK